jgi:hypothetical protein
LSERGKEAQEQAELTAPVYDDLLAARILEHVAAGQTLAWIEKQDGFPNRVTITDWYLFSDENERPGFGAKFVRARHIAWESMAEGAPVRR